MTWEWGIPRLTQAEATQRSGDGFSEEGHDSSLTNLTPLPQARWEVRRRHREVSGRTLRGRV